MVNYHKTLVSTLNTILPTHYELFLHRGLETPCISYMELDNSDREIGDTLGYSSLQYQIKVWGTDIGELQEYSQEIHSALRPLGWERISSNELHDRESAMIQKIFTYQAKAWETYDIKED